ncbi:MAG TPA: hypothetical protein PKA06_05870 [Gemmatales bacterium]|nr:hypothetical protein [Gemmatales bacterium]
MKASTLTVAKKHLMQDAKLQKIILEVGKFQPVPVSSENYYHVLACSIISQMISTKAASSIQRKLLERLKSEFITPGAILKLKPEEIRKVGLSLSKVSALQALAEQVRNQTIAVEKFGSMENKEIVQELTQIKGIGPWTAQMFLIFGLVRPDVWPEADLGLRMAVQKLDDLLQVPDIAYVRQRGLPFAPYRTVACWYLWQSLKL